MEYIDKICRIIILIFGVLTAHRIIYLVIGIFAKPVKHPPAKAAHRYAFVIAARNEEKVIGNLIASIRAQSLSPDAEIFVVADNCTDGTASLCRNLGATVYERTDPAHARKGYALEYLFDCLKRDFGTGTFEGYFIFDADNLLHPDFVKKMNDAFDTGAKLITSYRNTKNFDTNWISSGYGIHFQNNSMTLHRPRSLLGSGTHLTGTGYLISSELLSDGWHYVTFTEDDQITMAMAGKNIKVAYCDEAEFFDEQPCDLKTVMRQRVRWAKGRLVNFFRYGIKAFCGIFRYGSWTCYDMFTHYFPYGLFTWVLATIYPAATFIAGIFSETNDYGAMAVTLLGTLGTKYIYSLASSAVTVIKERRRIHCSAAKLVLFTFLSPWFNLISVPVYIIAIFTRVKWKPIVHNDTRNISSLIKNKK